MGDLLTERGETDLENEGNHYFMKHTESTEEDLSVLIVDATLEFTSACFRIHLRPTELPRRTYYYCP